MTFDKLVERILVGILSFFLFMMVVGAVGELFWPGLGA